MDERRVRFTDEYVPGPEGCPVWGIEEQWTFSVPAYVRAETEDEAMEIYDQYYKEHPDEMKQMMLDEIKANDPGIDFASWFHMNSDEGWGDSKIKTTEYTRRDA